MLQPRAVGRILTAVALCAALSWTGSAAALTRVLALGDFGTGGTTERDMGSAIRKFESAHPSDALVTFMSRLAAVIEEELAEPFDNSNGSFAAGFTAGVRAVVEALRTTATEAK